MNPKDWPQPKYKAFRLIGVMILGYCLITGVTYAMQEKMIYYPDRTPPNEAMSAAMGLRFWPGQGRPDYRGFVSPEALLKPKGTIVVFHGNAGSALDRGYYVAALEPRGYRVILAEYPGFGGRPGKLGEGPIVKDGKATVKLAYEEYGGPLYLWGESLGAGVVGAIVSDVAVPVSGVVMLTPWDTLPNLAQAIYWFLPARWLIRDQYDSMKNLANYGGRVALLVAENDEVIPKRHGLRLFESIHGPKKLWEFRRANHNTWPADPGEPWWDEVLAFLAFAFGSGPN